MLHSCPLCFLHRQSGTAWHSCSTERVDAHLRNPYMAPHQHVHVGHESVVERCLGPWHEGAGVETGHKTMISKQSLLRYHTLRRTQSNGHDLLMICFAMQYSPEHGMMEYLRSSSLPSLQQHSVAKLREIQTVFIFFARASSSLLCVVSGLQGTVS